jgi:elongation factor 1-gamma
LPPLISSFDHQGFSIWRVDFKYNEELTLTFMSSNQIGGFFNRLEASRKYLFGSVGVLGQNNNSVISGVFILRGQEFLPVLDVAPDWESYAFKKIELSNEEDKSFFEAALAWDLELDGKKWVDGKNVSVSPTSLPLSRLTSERVRHILVQVKIVE